MREVKWDKQMLKLIFRAQKANFFKSQERRFCSYLSSNRLVFGTFEKILNLLGIQFLLLLQRKDLGEFFCRTWCPGVVDQLRLIT